MPRAARTTGDLLSVSAAPAGRRLSRRRTPAPAAPLTPSSLVKVPERSLRCCPQCGSPRLMQIAMTLTDGSPVDFVSCRHCERRSWVQGGEILAIDSVLTKATKRG